METSEYGTDRINIPEQVSDKSKKIEQDAFFERMREERERRLTRFSQAMDREDFVRFAEAMELFDGELNVSDEAFECHLRQYFDALISLLEKAVEKHSSGAGDSLIYRQALEELYLINCEKVKWDNSYRLSRKHPVLLMNRRLDEDTKKLLIEKRTEAEKDGESLSRTDYEILRSVFEAKMANRRRMKLYSGNAVYEVKPESFDDGKDFVYAPLFSQSECNTKIPRIRIWEKISNYLEQHPGKDSVRIAVFGFMTDFREYDELLQELLDVKIEWINFQRMPMTGEYFFADDTRQEVYDLLDMSDLQVLTDNFEIILFLDQNCFYRQGQAEKDMREKSAGTHCRWNYERSCAAKQFKDKAAFYQVIYNRAGQWINSADSNLSAAFEFDERLYKNLEAVSKENTDIYLYIKYGSCIGKQKLSNNGICNDEYYNGISLTVCRLTQSDMRQFNEDYGVFLRESAEKQENDFTVPIKFWKLLKSVSNEYCDEILKRFSRESGGKLRDIVPFLNTSYLVLKYAINSKDGKISIRYKLFTQEAKDFPELRKPMTDIIDNILKYAFYKEDLYCINRYFERLMIYSVISNANDVGDLIFAHWIATHWYKTEGLESEDFEEQSLSGAFASCKNRFKVRKTIYSIIDQLNDMRMRDIPNMQGYFFSSFHGRVCPEVDTEKVEKTFRLIRSYCERFQYTGGYLYTNSGLAER